jgi:asparagine synthase (glutamine-hydrolysing)
MSGIAGILRFDSEPVSRGDLERAANALEAHGPDRRALYVDRNIGLVHRLMRMTPEDSFDRQPWRGASGAYICGDLRLDNRQEMLLRLGIPAGMAASWPDSRLALAAWEAFGDDVWAALVGPFAVAIWDPARQVLRLARDHLGLNVFVWHRAERFFCFASMAKGLFAMPDVPRTLNKSKVADFLVLNHAEHETTVYEGIFRVPPAHVIEVDVYGRLSKRRYWSVSDIAPVRLPSDQDYADALRERLDDAVRRQARSAHPVCSHLTGGLDSSSVAVLLARLLKEEGKRLPTYTHVPRQGFCGPVPSGWYADETPHVEAIAAWAGNIDLHLVRNDVCDDFAEVDRFTPVFQAPIRNPTNLGWMLAIARLARSRGQRVMFCGLHGNYTHSWDGWEQVARNVELGRLRTAARQWRLFYEEKGYSAWETLETLVLRPLLRKRVAAWRQRHGRGEQAAPWRSFSAIRPDFAAVTAVDERAARLGHDFSYDLVPGTRSDEMMAVDYYGDWLAAQKAATDVEVRDPSADLHVVSYCFGVPQEQFLAEGISRSLIRRAMWGLAPPAILANKAKGAQSPDWHEKLGNGRRALAAEVDALSSSALAREMIDIGRLRRDLETWPSEGWDRKEVIEEYHLALSRGIAVGKFLRWFDSANS